MRQPINSAYALTRLLLHANKSEILISNVFKKSYLTIILVLLLSLMFLPKLFLGQPCPFVYFQFENNNVSQSPAINTALTISNPGTYSSGGLVGNYSQRNATSNSAICNTGITNNTLIGFTIQMLIRFDQDFGLQRNAELFRFGNSGANFEYPKIVFYTGTYNGSNFSDDQIIQLDGNGRKSFSYYADNNWHHLVFVFDASIGLKQIWVDGQLPVGFDKTITTTGTVGGNNELSLSTGSSYAKFVGGMDEIAVYDQAISGGRIYNDYLLAFAGQHIDLSCSIQSPPSPDPVTGPLDINDFPIGFNLSNPLDFSGVEFQQDQLFSYPLARFKPNHEFLPNVNIMDPEYLGGKISTQPPPNDPVPLSTLIQDELAKNWNYYFMVSENTGGFLGNFDQAWITHASLYPEFKRSVFAYRAQIPGSVIVSTSLTPDHYLRNSGGVFIDENCATGVKRWSPAALLTDYDPDGLTQRGYLQNILLSLTPQRLDFVGENNEVTYTYKDPQDLLGPCPLTSDPDVVTHKNTSFPSLTWPEYQGTRKMQLDNRYRDAFMGLDPSFQSVLPGLENSLFLNYAVDGQPDWRVNYQQLRQTQKSINNNYYSTPDIYPEEPFYWRTINGATHGWQWLIETRDKEIEPPFNDNRFSPYVAAGWAEDGTEHIRPGQWLGFLKCVGLMGVDFYHTGYFNGVNGIPHTDPKGWVWQAAPPVYAQAVLTHAQPFFTDGYVLRGDVPLFLNIPGGNKGFMFTTGNANELVVVRQKNTTNDYLISGTIQKVTNMLGNAPLSRDVEIDLNGLILKFNIRRQGSTYIYNNDDPLSPSFYQIDKWHQYEHPQRWTSDFDFEAEIFDNDNSSATIATENPLTPHVPITNGDYLSYNSYVTFENNASVSSLNYHFQPRHESPTDIPNDYTFYVRARSKTGNLTGISVRLQTSNNASTLLEFTMGCISNLSWDWYAFDMCGSVIQFNGLTDNVTYLLSLTPLNNELEIDQIYLESSSAPVFNPSVPTSCNFDESFDIGVTPNSSMLPFNLYQNNTIELIGSGVFTVDNNFSLENCNVIVDQDIEIVIAGTGTFNITGTNFSTCGNYTWEGITNEGGTIISLGSRVADAVSALDNYSSTALAYFTGSQFDLAHTLFSNNNIGMQLGHDDFSASFSLNGCRFDCPGGVLSKGVNSGIPHLYDFYLELDAPVNSIKIGDQAFSKNIFGNAYYGIYSINSNLTVENNEFIYSSQIPDAFKLMKRNALVTIGDGYNLLNYNIIVGGSAGKANTFQNWYRGVWGIAVDDASIEFNIFKETNYATLLDGIQFRSILVNDNVYQDCYSGTWLWECHGSRITIQSNTFNKAIPYDFNKYDYQAIRVESSPRVPNQWVNIHDNDIYNCNIGIHLRNIDGAQISKIPGQPETTSNRYHTDANNNDLALLSNHYGIWLENCYSTLVENNLISRTYNFSDQNTVSGPLQQDLLRGISYDRSPRSKILDNKTINMGTDIRALGDCFDAVMLCNWMENSFQGISLVSAIIAFPHGNVNDPTNNSWHGDYCNVGSGGINKLRVAGMANGAPINYYHANTTCELDLDNFSYTQYSPLAINAIVTSGANNCYFQLAGDGDEASMLADIAQDSTEYIDFPIENRFYEDGFAFDALDNDTGLMYLNLPTDYYLQQFYAAQQQGNIGKSKDVRDYISLKNKQAAQIANWAIVDSTVILQNLKTVNEIYLEYFMDVIGEVVLDSVTKAILESIAYQNPIQGGDAVYMARAMLRIDVEDQINVMRIKHPVQETKTTPVYHVRIYPNPATTEFNIEYFFDENSSALIEITNLVGQKILTKTLDTNQHLTKIPSSNFNPGIYFYKILLNGKQKEAGKIVLVK